MTLLSKFTGRLEKRIKDTSIHTLFLKKTGLSTGNIDGSVAKF